MKCGCSIILLLLPLAASPVSASKEGHHRDPLRGVHSLDVYADGAALHVLTGEYATNAKAPQLRYRRSTDGGVTWTAPFRVDSGIKPYQAIHRGNDAQIAARGKQLVAVWHTPGTGFHGSGPMATAFSADGGASWRPGPNPADDGSTAGHSYIDIAADAAGFHLVWLDGRSGNQGLQYARSRNGGGSWERNVQLAARTCECCWNTVLPQPNGPLHVLYRGYDPRDMMLLSSTDAGASWRNRGAVGRFDWKVKACPHTGGALVAGPAARLHALSWTGRDDAVGLYAMVSDNGGGSWKQTQRLGGGTAQRGDLAAHGTSLAAVWDEHADGGTAIFASIFAGGTGWGAPRRLSAAGTHATYPRVAATATGFLVLWTEQAKGGPNVLRQALVSAAR
jgi:hypothetical protein